MTRLARALVLGLVVLVVTLAAPGASRADAAVNGGTPGGAWLRVGHFVAGMGSASVDLTPSGGTGAGETVMTPADGVAYGDVSSYQQVASGTYTATVRSTTAAPSDTPLLSSTFTVVAGDARTLALLGTADTPRLALLTDDLTTPPADAVRVRVLGAASGPATNLDARDGPRVADGIVLGQATPYTTVPAGTWKLVLSGGPGRTSARVRLVSGSVYTVVVLDDAAGSGGTRLDVVTDAAGATTAPRGGAHTGGGFLAGVPAGEGLLPAALAATSDGPDAHPVRVVVPAIGVDATTTSLGIARDGTVDVPGNGRQVGWVRTTSEPGEQGPSVLAGHVDTTTGPAVFARLASVRPGDRVLVTRRDGTTVEFRVDGLRDYAQAHFPTSAVYGPVPGPVLRLITCGGGYDATRGGYQDNVVVFAS